jgi:hypothetical protein
MALSICERHKRRMDEATLSLCLHHLQEAERLMIEGVDGWHLARLSHVIESLREHYGPRLWPAAAAIPAIQ